MVAWALMEESLGDIGRTRQLLEIAVATQAGNPDVWNVSAPRVWLVLDVEIFSIYRDIESRIYSGVSNIIFNIDLRYIDYRCTVSNFDMSKYRCTVSIFDISKY